MGDDQLMIVGIGASAGGLEPLEALFTAMPRETGMAFVVLQHLSPNFESRMDELLGRRTRIPVTQVTDGLEVEPDHVYLIPPRKEMILNSGRLLLTDKDPEQALHLPIDRFFRSLAQEAGSRAVAIVLSGTGSDGSRGIAEVHAAGGLVICQDPATARFDGMPRAALATGVVKADLAPSAMPDLLVAHASGAEPVSVERTLMTPSEEALDAIYGAIRDEYGVDFANYKPTTVLRRIERRISATREADVSGYARRLRSDRSELSRLYEDLLIGVTSFFRDPEAFAIVGHQLVPDLVANGEEIRGWVPGCATGEEVYSLAILFHEAAERLGRRLRLKIFATDVHPGALDRAAAGVYDSPSLEAVSEERRRRFFTRQDGRFRIAKEIREDVVFARHSVLSDAPFTRLDFVSCRNLLIYFDTAAQRRVLSLFHFGLKTGGVLFLGSSETPGELGDEAAGRADSGGEFETIDQKWRIYRKVRDAKLPLRLQPGVRSGRPSPDAASSLPVRRPQQPVSLPIYDRLLERHMPPALLLDDRYDLVHSFARAEALLRVRGGRTSLNALDLVPESLRGPLAAGLQQARKERAPVHYRGLDLDLGGEPGRYRVGVVPIVGATIEQLHFLVELEKTEEPPPDRGAPLELDESSSEYVRTLESELQSSRENLQATIEELETSNEELQATNEELVASNEELQSTNEELQSVNEELHTVNAEHQDKISELTELTRDMESLLQATEVGVVFLDRELRVRKFTTSAAPRFHLLPQDVGRPFDHFASQIEHPGLVDEARSVMTTGETVEREVTAEGRPHLLRLLPYGDRDDPGGVVLTLVDVSSLRRLESEARQLAEAVRSAGEAIAACDLDGTITAWNAGAEHLTGYSADEAVGHSLRMLIPDDRFHELDRILRAPGRGELVPPYDTVWCSKEGREIDVAVSVSPFVDLSGAPRGASVIARDIGSRRRAEEKAQRAIQQRDRFLALLSHELRNPLMGISNAVQVLQTDGTTVEQQGRARAVVRRQVAQMARLLEDLLDSSRMRHDSVELSLRKLDLRDVVVGAMDAVGPRAAAAGVRVDVDVPEDALFVHGDATRLQQLLVNLLNNAVRHSFRDGVVRLCSRRDGERAVLLEVADEGEGIEPGLLSELFEPFFQSNRTSSSEGSMGLGLALARSIAVAHQGEIEARSEGLGRGAAFVVRLPAYDATEAAETLAPEDRDSGHHRRLVAIVDDDADGREMLSLLLQASGYEVLEAGSGRAGLELLREWRPPVAVVDIGLPDMSGLELARELRQTVAPSETKLIALTGFGQQSDRERAIAAGFDRHVVKPLDYDRILEVLGLPSQAVDT